MSFLKQNKLPPQARGDYVKAIDELHASLLQSQLRWRLHTTLRGLAQAHSSIEQYTHT